MSLVTQLSALATRIGTEFKVVYGQIGALNGLNTTTKTSIVLAVNEVNTKTGTMVNDAVPSSTSAYSSNKTDAQIAAAKASILGGASAAFDTLSELESRFGTDESAVATLTTSVGNRLRLDAAGSYTSGQQQQGRDNLSVYSQAQIGDPTTDLVAVFVAALV